MLNPILDAVLACAPAASAMGVLGFIGGIVTAVFLIGIFQGMSSDEEAMERIELAAPTDEEKAVEDAIRAGIVRGFLEGTVSRGRDDRFEPRRDAARLFADGYLRDRRKMLRATPSLRPSQPETASS